MEDGGASDRLLRRGIVRLCRERARFELLFQRPTAIGKRLLIEHPRFELRHDAMGSWQVVGLEQTAASSQGLDETVLAWLALAREAHVTEGEIVIRDKARPEILQIADITLTATVEEGGTDAAVQLLCTLTAEGTPATLQFHGHLGPTSSSGGLAPFGAGLGNRITTVAGLIEVKDLTVEPIIRLMGGSRTLSGLADRLYGRAQIELCLNKASYDLLVQEVEADLGWVALMGRGQLQGLFTATPTWDITLREP